MALFTITTCRYLRLALCLFLSFQLAPVSLWPNADGGKRIRMCKFNITYSGLLASQTVLFLLMFNVGSRDFSFSQGRHLMNLFSLFVVVVVLPKRNEEERYIRG